MSDKLMFSFPSYVNPQVDTRAKRHTIASKYWIRQVGDARAVSVGDLHSGITIALFTRKRGTGRMMTVMRRLRKGRRTTVSH